MHTFTPLPLLEKSQVTKTIENELKQSAYKLAIAVHRLCVKSD